MGWLDKLVAEVAAHPRPMSPVPPAPEDPLAHAQEIARRLRGQGWCLVYSELLGEEEIYARDDAVEQVPGGFVVYTESELKELFGEGKPSPGAATLRLLHEAKRHGARVVRD